MKTYNLYTQLSQDYVSFYENGKEYADIIIRVGKKENAKEFNVHSFVLLVRSIFFRKEIKEMKEKTDDEKIVIEKPDINPKLFDQILRYFYGGNLKYDPSEIFDLLLISKEFNISELLELLQDQLLQSQDQIYRYFSTTYQISSSHELFKKLDEFCLKTIQERPEIIFKSRDFHLLNEDTLLVLLQNKELKLNEIEIWESVIKWGVYHTFADISSSTILASSENFNEMPDVSLWTKDKFRDLSCTLKQFIPLINLYKINAEDFYEKVKPFKKILDKQLYDDILKYYIFSKNSSSTITSQINNPTNLPPSVEQNEPAQPSFSTSASTPVSLQQTALINLEYFQLITGWINETTNTPSNHYRLSLLLRGSEDGFTANKFHELCDNKGATLSIIKIHGSNEIIGGYNPESWDKSLYPNNQYSNVTESFVFKLNNINVNNSIIGRPRNPPHTIGNHPDRGPVFVGALYLLGGDFKREAQSVCRGLAYNVNLRSDQKFSVEEYEVYQVIKE